jgi:hypothetical protein
MDYVGVPLFTSTYGLKSAIEKAQNYQELSVVTPQFPNAILDSK